MKTLQAIVTKYHGPTSTQPGRIIATAEAGRVVHYYDHGRSQDANHDEAARKLADKLGWAGSWYRGGLPERRCNAYVCQGFSTLRESEGCAFMTVKGE